VTVYFSFGPIFWGRKQKSIFLTVLVTLRGKKPYKLENAIKSLGREI
jgi:hypothetical protein